MAGTFLGNNRWTGYDRTTLIGRLRVLTMQYRDLVIDDKRRGGRSSGEAEYKRFMDQFGGTSLDTLLGDDALRLKFMQAVQGRAQEIHNLRAEQVNNIAYTDQNTAIEVRDKAKSFLANLGDIQKIVHEEKMSEKKAEQLKASQGNACGSSKENGATFIEGDVVQAGGQYAVCEVKGFNIISKAVPSGKTGLVSLLSLSTVKLIQKEQEKSSVKSKSKFPTVRYLILSSSSPFAIAASFNCKSCLIRLLLRLASSILSLFDFFAKGCSLAISLSGLIIFYTLEILPAF